MEMESLHTPDNIQTAGLEPSSRSASYRDAQVWKDIEAETGFASYADYLEYYSDLQPAFINKRDDYHRFPEDEDAMPANKRHRTFIYDLSVQETSLAKLSLRHLCDSGTELIEALREPPDGISVQLVLWFTSDLPLNQEMADALVLGLKLDLDDFSPRRPWSPTPKNFTYQVKSIFGDQTVATISQDFMPDVANAVPVVLVASRHFYWSIAYSVFIKNKGWKPPILKSSGQSLRLEVIDDIYDTPEFAGQVYARVVEHIIMQDTVLHSTKPFLLIAAMSPLLYMEECCIIRSFNSLETLYTDLMFVHPDHYGEEKDRMDRLDAHRLRLRRILEVSEDRLDQFSRFLGLEAHSNLSENPSYPGIMTTLRSLIADARRLDTEVQDFKRFQVGELALEESRKAIVLSNAQIREAKSGKSGEGI